MLLCSRVHVGHTSPTGLSQQVCVCFHCTQDKKDTYLNDKKKLALHFNRKYIINSIQKL